jgi:hypothetical protein
VVARPDVEPEAPLTPADKLRLSLDMFTYGCEIMRQNLRRADPAAGDALIEERLRAWLRERPGAEHGDGVGKPVSWPRVRGNGDA